MNKPKRARPLADVLRKTLNDAFAQQGFASTELITRWPEIVGAEIAAHSEPEKIRWPRPVANEPPEPATLLLRVEGPTAIEIQHLSSLILERVNRFFGWQAVSAADPARGGEAAGARRRGGRPRRRHARRHHGRRAARRPGAAGRGGEGALNLCHILAVAGFAAVAVAIKGL
jgi:hypothetical protein